MTAGQHPAISPNRIDPRRPSREGVDFAPSVAPLDGRDLDGPSPLTRVAGGRGERGGGRSENPVLQVAAAAEPFPPRGRDLAGVHAVRIEDEQEDAPPFAEADQSAVRPLQRHLGEIVAGRDLTLAAAAAECALPDRNALGGRQQSQRRHDDPFPPRPRPSGGHPIRERLVISAVSHSIPPHLENRGHLAGRRPLRNKHDSSRPRIVQRERPPGLLDWSARPAFGPGPGGGRREVGRHHVPGQPVLRRAGIARFGSGNCQYG